MIESTSSPYMPTKGEESECSRRESLSVAFDETTESMASPATESLASPRIDECITSPRKDYPHTEVSFFKNRRISRDPSVKSPLSPLGGSKSTQEISPRTLERKLDKKALSLEELSIKEAAHRGFSIEWYKNLPFSDSKRLGNELLNELNNRLDQGILQPITPSSVGEIVEGLIAHTIATACSSGETLLKKSALEIDEMALSHAQKIYQRLDREDLLCRKLKENLLFLKMVISNIWSKKRSKDRYKNRTPLTDDLLFSLESLIQRAPQERKKKIAADFRDKTPLFFDLFYKKGIGDSKVKETLFKAVHLERETAAKSLTHIAAWGGAGGIAKIKKEVKKKIESELYRRSALKQSLQCKNAAPLIEGYLKRVDWHQVARSYLESPSVIPDIVLNGEVLVVEISPGKTIEMQRSFIKSYLEKLHLLGIKGEGDTSEVDREVDQFFAGKPFPGREILFFGSNSGWHICDSNMREIFPSLFESPFRMRALQGTRIAVEVQSSKEYSIEVAKPLLLTCQGEEVAAIKLHWRVSFAENEGFSYKISMPAIDKCEGCIERHWEIALSYLKAPHPSASGVAIS